MRFNVTGVTALVCRGLSRLNGQIQRGGRALQFSRSISFNYHSKPLEFTQADMKVKLVPALEDNYMYLIIDEKTKACAAIDPVEPNKILETVIEEDLGTFKQALVTHHHWDHAGGTDELAALVGGIEIYGGDERIQKLNKKVTHGDEFKIGSLNVKCLFTPCHTSGHICYFVTGDDGQDPAVFTGDTLFVGGCGKFFEGNPQQMYTALIEILSKLPANTKVYCGHEYAVNNLKYALSVEPENFALQQKMVWAQEQRKHNKPTVPSTIGEEMQYNPFMRVGEAPVQVHTKSTNPVEVMGKLRQDKDNFKAK